MLLNYLLPLVNWGIGTLLMLFFGVVCIVLLIIVHRMVHSDKKKNGSR